MYIMPFYLRKLIVFVSVILAVLLSSAAGRCLAYGEEKAGINQEIIEEKLKSSEIRSIKEAVDKEIKKTPLMKEFDLSSQDILDGALKGRPLESLKGLPKILVTVLGKEIKANLVLILQLFAVMLLGAVIRSLQPLNSGISNEVAKLGINGVLIVISAVSFGSVVEIARTTIGSMQSIASLAMPALFALMAASGRIVSVTAIQPLMLFGVNVACHLFKTVLLPLAVMAGLLFLVDSVSERFKVKTLAKLLKSIAVWITGVVAFVFSLIVSIQRIASASVDAVTLKTTKFAIGTFIPVAGKYMADAADTILLCTSAASNIAGILTVAGLIIVSVMPFIKVFVIMLSFRLAAAFSAPICDENICEALEEAAGCLSVILGIMGAALFTVILLAGALMNASGVLK
jgi:stage III sporulation protein AE